MNRSSSAPINCGALAVAIGIALATSTAHAATFTVTTNADAGAGSLREALTSANGSAGPHTVDFSAIAAQTITLASSLPEITQDMTLQGSEVTLSGDLQHGCLAAYNANLTVNSMTVTQCVAPAVPAGQQARDDGHRGIFGPAADYAGGGVRAVYGDLTINDSVITGNTAPFAVESYTSGGGGVAVVQGYLEINNSTISSNSAYSGGGIYSSGITTINDSVIADNTSYKYGGGIASFIPGGPTPVRGLQASLSLDATTISGNDSGVGGGALVVGVLSLNESEVTGNASEAAAGVMAIAPGSGFPAHQVVNSTISENNALYAYGGVTMLGSSSISGTTISGNQSQYYGGGGALLASKYETDQISLENSTISGNSAGEGGGVAIYGQAYDGTYTQVAFNGVTVTGNSATFGYGGGVLALAYGGEVPFRFSNSIIAGNTSAQGSTDLSASAPQGRSSRNWVGWRERLGTDRGVPLPSSVTFDFSFGLVGQAPDSGTFIPDAATTALLGSAPQLGPLAANGGTTLTHLPATNSPAVDAIPSGSNGCGGTFNVDQRGEARPQAGACDIGSVERAGAPVPPPIAVPVLDRIGLLVLALGAGLLGLFGLGRRRQQS